MAYRIANVGKTGILNIKKSNAERLKYRPDLGDVELDISSELNTNTSGQFNTITGGKLESCIVNISPKQNLNGYSKPWVGGSGKNKLQNTRTGTTEQHGLKITSNDDGSVFFHGGYTASVLSSYDLSTTQDIPNGSYILNGCPSGGGGSTFQISINDKNDTGLTNSFTDTGSGANVTISNGGVYRPRVIIRQGYTIPSDGLLFKPMLRLATVTDATFEPYTNICPITGHSSVKVGVFGKNKLPVSLADIKSFNTSGTWNGNVYTDNNVTFTCQTDSDGNLINVDVNGTAPIGTDIYFKLNTVANLNDVLVSGADYKFVCMPSGGSGTDDVYGFVGSSANDYGSGATFTAPASGSSVALRVTKNKTADNVVIKPMITTDLTATYDDYVPYNPNSKAYTISLGQTVYGGSVNVVSRELTVDKVCNTFDGSNDETIEVVAGTAFNRISCAISNDSITNSSSTEKTNKIWSDKYEEITDAMSNAGTIGVYYRANGSHKAIISAGEVGVTDVASARTWLSNNPVQICYVLATPTTIQLTPQQIETLIGQNNISVPLEGQTLDSLSYREMMAWDDVTDIVEPIADDVDDANEKGYIGFNLFERLEQGAISGTDGSLVSATTRCRSNDFVEIKSASYNITQLATVKTLIIQYDASKQFIVTDYSMWNNNITTYNFTPNSSAKYIKIATGFRTDAICTPSDFVSNTALSVKSNTQLDATKADITSIGTEETGATASKDYTVGEHFQKDGKFCTAIAPISSGATFTLNTNYEEGNVANSIDNGFFDLSQKRDVSSLIGTISTGQNSVTITPPISGLLSLGLRTSGSDSWVIAYDQTDSPSSNIIGGAASTKNATALVTTIPVNANRDVIIKYYGMSDLLCANIIPLKFK